MSATAWAWQGRCGGGDELGCEGGGEDEERCSTTKQKADPLGWLLGTWDSTWRCRGLFWRRIATLVGGRQWLGQRRPDRVVTRVPRHELTG